MTHLGLIVSIGGHADAALETFDKALAIDPKYPPAYLYRGQVLFEQKQDYAGAVKAWESFLKLVPNGEDHDRVVAMLQDAKSKQQTRQAAGHRPIRARAPRARADSVTCSSLARTRDPRLPCSHHAR